MDFFKNKSFFLYQCEELKQTVEFTELKKVITYFAKDILILHKSDKNTSFSNTRVNLKQGASINIEYGFNFFLKCWKFFSDVFNRKLENAIYTYGKKEKKEVLSYIDKFTSIKNDENDNINNNGNKEINKKINEEDNDDNNDNSSISNNHNSIIADNKNGNTRITNKFKNKTKIRN